MTVDGNDVLAVRKVALEATAAARSGQGPVLVEARTYRHRGHSVADPAAYRPAEEVAAWKARDPLTRHRDVAVAGGVDAAALDAVLSALREEVAALARRALDAPPPAPEGAWRDMWSDGSSTWRN